MADEDRQPPQAYDTVAPAGVGAASSNQMSPGAFQDLFFTGDQGLIDVAIEEMHPDPLYEFMQSIPPADVIASWPDVDGAPPAQTSSPAGVGSRVSHSAEQPRVLGVMGVDVVDVVADAGGLGLEVVDVVVLVPGVLLVVVVVAVVVAVVAVVAAVEVVVVEVVDDGGDDADDFSPLHLPPPLPDRLGVLADNLVPCVKPIYNDVYACY